MQVLYYKWELETYAKGEQWEIRLYGIFRVPTWNGGLSGDKS